MLQSYKKYSINAHVKQMAGAKNLNPNEVKEIADKIWDDVTVIDEYLAECKDIAEGRKEIKV